MASHTIKAALLLTLLMACGPALMMADGWHDGRASFYGNDGGATIHQGSCLFWNIDYWAGTGYNIAALSDQNWDFDQSCGRCYEVQCRPASFSDGYGQWLNRNDACYGGGKSVVVRITDACPCYYPGNSYSNKRWCCGDSGIQHFDLSYVAFEKLADKKHGVIGIRYREVPCPSGSPAVQQWQKDNRNRKGKQGSTY